MLRDIPGALLIDIRSKGQAQGQGSPDIGPGRSPIRLPYQEKPGRFFVEKLKSEVKVPKGCPVLLLDGDGSLSKAKGPEVARALGDAVQVYVVQGGFAGPRGWTESGLPVRSTPGPIPFPNLSLGGVRLPLATLPDDGYSLAPLGALLALAAAAYALRGPILGGALQLAGVLGLVQIFLTLASERQRRDAQEEVRQLVEALDPASAKDDLQRLAGSLTLVPAAPASTDQGLLRVVGGRPATESAAPSSKTVEQRVTAPEQHAIK
ncbi:hypothetical protein F751_3948 [Auxenochlorella protothecoides]|uniref:Rhodanese domain-containing protein n=1 Tax=Auxenochlorella protothecoides TaxID=3075 RepID=A0A087SHR4_AUXPR|nr:hypothetical protein F751_3948 [Auxenochlorella protothecoides]KFM25268.1 hypothetical protein F751_3948 [Auxenochlorella protothecoides]RMZ57637.1 hypothetical protein APUTEX25_001837 [Auxenochlorella protothecoides]|eukprot:RMZ57637.1 hypothetical protein APUTEX25_001837 [Auxenochlorella protothecoides]